MGGVAGDLWLRGCLLLGSLLTAASLGAVTSDYLPLRAELRAFYPDECHSPCKLKAQTDSVRALARGIDAYVAAHPEADALDIRRAFYLEMRKNFVPVLFRNLPFYFEAGVNGGWSIWSGDKAGAATRTSAIRCRCRICRGTFRIRPN